MPIADLLKQEEIVKYKWAYYEEACLLLSKFQSIKPLLLKYVPELNDEIVLLDGYYQNYRRVIRSDRPIYQGDDGKSEAKLPKMKNSHRALIINLINKI